MLRGIYAAATGMLVEQVRQEVIAGNLANADTAGYKRQVAVERPLAQFPLRRLGDGPGRTPAGVGVLGTGAALATTVTLFGQGGLRPTGNALDLALVGDGFFAVETPSGVRFTRDGAFMVDRDGYLVTAAGYRVLGEGGPLQVGSGRVEVDTEGRVTVDGVTRGRLQLVAFADVTVLRREGENLYSAPPGAGVPADASVKAGYLELSNVQPVREMVDLIAVMRSYEACQRLIKAHDETLGQAVNEIARV